MTNSIKPEWKKMTLQNDRNTSFSILPQKACGERTTLGRKDSNLRVTGPKPGALPLGHAPFLCRLDNKIIVLLSVRQF